MSKGYDVSRIMETLKSAIIADRYGLHTPRGNSKTGEIPAFNLLPFATCTTCAKHTCATEGCYAVKNCLCHGYDIEKNNALRAWTENTVFAMVHLAELENALVAWFERETSRVNGLRFFRVHSSGEFFSVKYAEMWYRIAARFPQVRFLAFTKAWYVVRAVDFYNLPNFSLVLSGWTGCPIPDDLRAHYRCSWCDDGTETRIPADAIECPGDCDHCGMCWNLPEIGRDVRFHKH